MNLEKVVGGGHPALVSHSNNRATLEIDAVLGLLDPPLPQAARGPNSARVLFCALWQGSIMVKTRWSSSGGARRSRLQEPFLHSPHRSRFVALLHPGPVGVEKELARIRWAGEESQPPRATWAPSTRKEREGVEVIVDRKVGRETANHNGRVRTSLELPSKAERVTRSIHLRVQTEPAAIKERS